MALNALEEATAKAHHTAVSRSWALRLALAYLGSRASERPDFVRWPFDRFWDAIGSTDRIGRWQNMNASLNGIYIAVGVERDHRRVSEFELRAGRAELEAKISMAEFSSDAAKPTRGPKPRS